MTGEKEDARASRRRLVIGAAVVCALGVAAPSRRASGWSCGGLSPCERSGEITAADGATFRGTFRGTGFQLGIQNASRVELDGEACAIGAETLNLTMRLAAAESHEGPNGELVVEFVDPRENDITWRNTRPQISIRSSDGSRTYNVHTMSLSLTPDGWLSATLTTSSLDPGTLTSDAGPTFTEGGVFRLEGPVSIHCSSETTKSFATAGGGSVEVRCATLDPDPPCEGPDERWTCAIGGVGR